MKGAHSSQAFCCIMHYVLHSTFQDCTVYAYSICIYVQYIPICITVLHYYQNTIQLCIKMWWFKGLSHSLHTLSFICRPLGSALEISNTLVWSITFLGRNVQRSESEDMQWGYFTIRFQFITESQCIFNTSCTFNQSWTLLSCTVSAWLSTIVGGAVHVKRKDWVITVQFRSARQFESCLNYEGIL